MSVFDPKRTIWLHTTREQAGRDVTEYIEMHYNSDRLHSTLDYITLRERELAAAA